MNNPISQHNSHLSHKKDSQPPLQKKDLFEDWFSPDLNHKEDTRVWQEIPLLNQVPQLVKENRLDEASDILKQAGEEFVDFDFTYAWLAQIHHKQGQFENALQTLLKGLELSKSKQVLCGRIGFLYAEHGDMEKAAEWWIKSISLIQSFKAKPAWEPYLYLGYMARACDLPAQAAILLKHASRIHGELILEKKAEADLLKKSETIKHGIVPEAITRLCTSLAGNHLTSKEAKDPAAAVQDMKEKPIFSAAGKYFKLAAAIIILVLFISAFFMFVSKKLPVPEITLPDKTENQITLEEDNKPAGESPAAESERIIDKTQQQSETGSAEKPEPKSEISDESIQNVLLREPDQAVEPETPANPGLIPSKKQPSYLKKKSKRPVERLQKKQQGTD